MVQHGITITVEWSDEDITEILISCSNGVFSGAALVYVSPDELLKMSEVLEGFPKTSNDKRELQLGTSDSYFAGGSASLTFHCTDSVGHSVVDFKIRADSHGLGVPGCAEFSVPIEAAAVDSFVEALRVPRRNFERAHLPARK
jgi:hypothetical protein